MFDQNHKKQIYKGYDEDSLDELCPAEDAAAAYRDITHLIFDWTETQMCIYFWSMSYKSEEEETGLKQEHNLSF